jgi:hypothetical protein
MKVNRTVIPRRMDGLRRSNDELGTQIVDAAGFVSQPNDLTSMYKDGGYCELQRDRPIFRVVGDQGAKMIELFDNKF